MAKSSFADLKSDCDEACAFLRSFTLGQRGFTHQDVVAGIRRLSGICDHLQEYADGPDAATAGASVASGRTDIVAAKARLALLRSMN